MKKMLKGTAQSILFLFAIIVLYLLFWPVKIDPAAYIPQEAPELSGVYAENDLLSGIEKLAEGYILGIDLHGNVRYNLQDPYGVFYPNTTSAIEYNGYLYLGSHKNSGIGRIAIH